jgi:sugar lactone lactonase YvrE
MTDRAIACTADQHELGEGARWDARRGELLHVDIAAGRVFRDVADADGGLIPRRTYDVPGTVGAIAPVQGDDGWLLAAGRGVSHLSEEGAVRLITEVAPPGTRMNDAACDPQGRFWAGTLAHDHHPGGGALYRLDRQGHVQLILGDLTISNGIAWSPDGGTMYLVDSGPRVVHAFDFDGDRGAIAHERVLIPPPEDGGAPDGLTVDAAGDLWVAIYGGGRVDHHAPDGTLLESLAVPAVEVTSCAFGGEGLHQLYVTTATEDWSDERRKDEPTAGLLYRFDTAATGRPAESFQPDLGWWGTVAP